MGGLQINRQLMQDASEGRSRCSKGKVCRQLAIQTEKQIQQQAVLARTAATNSISEEVGQAEKALEKIERKALQFENELVKDILKDAVIVEKEIVKDIEIVEGDVVQVENSVENSFRKLFGR